MFARVTLGAADPEASRRFYATVLATLGLAPDAGDFAIAPAGDDRPVTTRLHIGFAAPSREHADAFWRAGVDAGYRDDGAPGLRPEYGPDYYGAFLLDPDGNSAEAVWHDGLRDGGGIDHLWIRVADRAASRAFYADLGRHAGFQVGGDHADRTQFRRPPRGGSFSIVDGEPTTPFGLAFVADVAREPVRDPDGSTVEVVARDVRDG